MLLTFKWAKAKKTRKYQLNFLFFLFNKCTKKEILPNCISFVYKSAVSNALFK